MKYCFFKMGLDCPGVDAWFRGMYESMFSALRRLGADVTLSLEKPDSSADVLIVPLGGGQDRSSARAMSEFVGPVVAYVPSVRSWFREDFLKRWGDRIVLAYGTDVSPAANEHYSRLGVPYLHLPFASDPEVMRPLSLEPVFDVVFVGNATSGSGRYRFMDALFQRIDSDRVLLVGPGWERYGVAAQSIAWGPLLNAVYALGRVGLNLHNEEQDLGDVQLDANNRLFDLAMAGRPQVCNAPAVVGRYFAQSEVLSYAEPDEWADGIVRLLGDPDAVARVGTAAREHALRDHTWDVRADSLSRAVEAAIGVGASGTPGALGHVMRARDTMLPPYGPREFGAKVQRRLDRLVGGGSAR